MKWSLGEQPASAVAAPATPWLPLTRPQPSAIRLAHSQASRAKLLQQSTLNSVMKTPSLKLQNYQLWLKSRKPTKESAPNKKKSKILRRKSIEMHRLNSSSKSRLRERRKKRNDSKSVKACLSKKSMQQCNESRRARKHLQSKKKANVRMRWILNPSRMHLCGLML